LEGPTTDAALDTDLRWSRGLLSGSLLNAEGMMGGEIVIHNYTQMYGNEMSEISYF